MDSDDWADLFALVPRWWFEPVGGLSAAGAGVGGLVAGSLLVKTILETVFGPDPAAGFFSLDGIVVFTLALVLLVIVYGVVGIGFTAEYNSYRALEPGFVLEWPDREVTRWTVTLGLLAPVLVGAGTMSRQLIVVSGTSLPGAVPNAIVFFWSMGVFPNVRPAATVVGVGMQTVLLAGVVGPSAGVLFHGTVQNSVRQVAPTQLAAGVTAAAVATTNAPSVSDPLGLAVVAVFVSVVGIAYERTGNLAVPAISYAVLNAATIGTMLMIVLLDLGRI